MESLKKTQTEVKLEMKSLGIHAESSKESFTNRILKMEERILSTEDKIEEINTLVKGNVKFKKIKK